MHAQDLRADRMEGAEPRHGLLGPGESGDAHAHLARRLVGEGHRQDLIGASAAGGDEMRDPGGQHARLADAGAGENEHRPVQRLDRALLLVIQSIEIRRIGVRATDKRPRASSVGRAAARQPPARMFRDAGPRIESCAGQPSGATQDANLSGPRTPAPADPLEFRALVEWLASLQPPPPLWGREGVGGRANRWRLSFRDPSSGTAAARPPSLILPRKGGGDA